MRRPSDPTSRERCGCVGACLASRQAESPDRVDIRAKPQADGADGEAHKKRSAGAEHFIPAARRAATPVCVGDGTGRRALACPDRRRADSSRGTVNEGCGSPPSPPEPLAVTAMPGASPQRPPVLRGMDDVADTRDEPSESRQILRHWSKALRFGILLARDFSFVL